MAGLTRASSALRIAVALAALSTAPVARADEGELVFGMTGPFTGTARDMGAAVRSGIEVAFAAQNDAGGVHGRKLKLVALDDGYDPARAAAAMKELVTTHKVFGVIGSVGTPGAEAAYPIANDKGVLFFGAVSGAGFLRNSPPDRYVFNYRASYAEETAAIVKYLVGVRRIPPARIAFLGETGAFGDAGFEGVARSLRHYGYDPAKTMRLRYPRGTADVDGAVRDVVKRSKELGAVVMFATLRPASRFIERLRDAKVRGLAVVSVSDVGASTLADELGQLGVGYAEGVVVTQVVPLPASNTPTIAKYRDQVQRYAPADRPGSLSLEGWLSARLLIEGLQRAGKNPSVEGVINALESMRAIDLGIGAPLGLGPSEHQASHTVWGAILDGKVLQPLDLQ